MVIGEVADGSKNLSPNACLGSNLLPGDEEGDLSGDRSCIDLYIAKRSIDGDLENIIVIDSLDAKGCAERLRRNSEGHVHIAAGKGNVSQ